MTTIRQTCPSCSRLLELPETAVGKMAKCPACQTQFAVPASAGDVQPAPSGSGSPYSAPLSGTIGGTIGGSGSPRPVGGDFSGAARAQNPYQPSAATAPVTQIGSLQIGARSIEEIFGVTLGIFKERWGSLVGAFLIVFLISIAMFVTTSVIGMMVQANAGQDVGGLVQALMSLVTYPISAYLYLGLVRNAIAVARNHPTPMNELISPMDCYLRFLGGGFLMGLAFVGATAVVGGIIAAIAFMGGGQAAALGGLVLALVVLVPLAMIMWWALWAWPFVVSDGKGSLIGSIKVAYAISMNNKMTSLLLLIIATAMSIAGLMACYVGQVISTPLTTLMMSVAYLLITNQAVQDPRMVMQHQAFAPRPNSPTF